MKKNYLLRSTAFIFMIGLGSLHLLQCDRSAESHDDHPHSYAHSDHGHEHAQEDHTHDQNQLAKEHTKEHHSHDHDAEHDHSDHEHSHVEEAHGHSHSNNASEHEHDSEIDRIMIDEEMIDLIGLTTTKVIKTNLDQTLNVPAKLIADPDRKAVISPFIEAAVNCVFVKDGDVVKKGTILACLASPELGMKRAEYDKAAAELQIEEQQFKRKGELYKEKIISQRSYEEAQLQLEKAKVNYNFAKSSLLTLGISESEIKNPSTEHTDIAGSTLHITSPIAGTIIKRQANVGQKVNSESILFEIMDLDELWLEAQVFEKDLHQLAIGQILKIELSGTTDNEYKGKIFHIGNKVDEQHRTLHVLVKISNKKRILKPGMFVNARIVIDQKQNVLTIPKQAVLDEAGVQFVFVKDENYFYRQNVKTGIKDGALIEITNGLKKGVEVVVQGGYQLKSQARMGTVDPHAGHVH